MCKNAIEGNPNAVADYKGGKEKALMSLLGNVMKQSRGKADAQAVRVKLIEMIK
jgi:aspartyl-tRNA(Asn)/glutamyl-tRNA(Gln) amidotransferase subunit B